MGYKLSSMILAVALVVFAAEQVQAVTDVFNMGLGLTSLEMVTVGNPGNAADDTGYGAVDHAYNIGKYEVTAGQYTAFLNAVAKTDTYTLFDTNLYNTNMSNTSYGSGITRSGSSGSFSYTVDSAFVNRPVNYVSFWDAARFTNWLNNGQGNGSTETGAYTLNGYNGGDGRTIKKNTDATWWVPSEDEWYKAAYHNKSAGTAASYFKYPTSSNTDPGQNMLDPLPGNNANYFATLPPTPIDSGKYTTVAGEFQNSASPYGTFDQGGNVWEWNDSNIDGGSSRGFRGGSYHMGFGYSCAPDLASSGRNGTGPTNEYTDIGFRVASVPEPGSISLLVAGAIAGLIWWRRRK